MKIIAGLGNPGKQYEKNRHNLGFMVVDQLANELKAKWQDLPRFNAYLAKTNFNEEKVFLVKPKTFMNKSGEAISKVANYYKIYPNDVWIIYDDVDLELADVRVRKEGSAGGHKGMQSIIEHLGTEKISRIKVGIGENRKVGMTAEDYVLKNFPKKEKITIDKVIADLVQRIPEEIQ